MLLWPGLRPRPVPYAGESMVVLAKGPQGEAALKAWNKFEG